MAIRSIRRTRLKEAAVSDMRTWGGGPGQGRESEGDGIYDQYKHFAVRSDTSL